MKRILRNLAGAAVAATAIAAFILVGCASAATSPYRFMIGEAFVNAIVADPQANAALDGTRPLINITTIKSPEGVPAHFPATPPASVPAAWHAIFMYRWASETQMALDMPHVPKWITVCMYDNEDARQYPMTPDEEIAHPAMHVGRAAQTCHNAGKQFIPSSSVRQFRRQNQSENDMVYHTASQWDGYSMQTQMFELDPQRFHSAIDDFESHIRAVNPNVTQFIVGVGDYANATLVQPPQIEAAIRSLPPGTIVWMNFGPHAGGPRCSVCPIPERPDLLVQVIKDLAR